MARALTPPFGRPYRPAERHETPRAIHGSALIVIDMQPDFCPGGRLAVAGGTRSWPRINDLMADFDAVVLTQDWHPHDHSSFAENHGRRPRFR